MYQYRREQHHTHPSILLSTLALPWFVILLCSVVAVEAFVGVQDGVHVRPWFTFSDRTSRMLVKSLSSSTCSTPHTRTSTSVKTTLFSSSSTSISEVEEKLVEIGRRLKLTVLDLDEGIYGYDSQDNRFGLEVIHSSITVPPDGESLGLQLTEIASSTSQDGRGLVLVSDVFGEAAAQVKDSAVSSSASNDRLKVGDVLTGVRVEGSNFSERLTGLDYDLIVEAIGRAKEAAEACRRQGSTVNPVLNFEANRLVERAAITVDLVERDNDQSSSVRSIDALAGENLRRLLQRKGVQVYNRKTKRFDMPYATGDCAGKCQNVVCGVCVCVSVRAHVFTCKLLEELGNVISRYYLINARSCFGLVGIRFTVR